MIIESIINNTGSSLEELSESALSKYFHKNSIDRLIRNLNSLAITDRKSKGLDTIYSLEKESWGVHLNETFWTAASKATFTDGNVKSKFSKDMHMLKNIMADCLLILRVKQSNKAEELITDFNKIIKYAKSDLEKIMKDYESFKDAGSDGIIFRRNMNKLVNIASQMLSYTNKHVLSITK